MWYVECACVCDAGLALLISCDEHLRLDLQGSCSTVLFSCPCMLLISGLSQAAKMTGELFSYFRKCVHGCHLFSCLLEFAGGVCTCDLVTQMVVSCDNVTCLQVTRTPCPCSVERQCSNHHLLTMLGTTVTSTGTGNTGRGHSVQSCARQLSTGRA